MSRGLVADSRSLVYASCSSIYDQDNHRCPGVFRTELRSSSHTTLLVSHHLQMESGLSPCLASLFLSCLRVCVGVRRSLLSLCVCVRVCVYTPLSLSVSLSLSPSSSTLAFLLPVQSYPSDLENSLLQSTRFNVLKKMQTRLRQMKQSL